MSRLVRLILFGGLLVALLPSAAIAQTPLSVTTPYPAITADPGGTASFELSISTEQPARVDLAVDQVPPEWTARFRGGGSIISAVFSDTVEPAEATLELDIPADAQPGEYDVSVRASGAATTVTLALTVTIESASQGSVELEAQYPALRGTADADFRFDLTLRNDTNEERTFSLEAVAPQGWIATARPAGEAQAATAVVAAGSTTRVQVTVSAPRAAPAGQYPIFVRASGGPQPAEVALAVEITGSYAMSLSTQDQRLNTTVTVGQPSTLTLVLTNTGTAPLENVRLTATPPRDWEATFEPATVAAIPAGGEETIVLSLNPSGNAIAGDYAVTVSATTDEAASEIDLRATVQASPLWGMVGLALLAAVGVGLLLVFRRYGRR
jgi:uncharacterized repeat protein (TIGR01451 family)